MFVMLLGRFPLLVVVLAVLAGGVVLSAQSVRVQDLGIGKLLVARRDAPDPTFAETVILLVRYENSGTVGLVINRRSNVPVSEALGKFNGSKQRSEPVYSGGPVEPQSVLALLRANTMPEGAAPVVGKLYLVSTKPVLEKSLAGQVGPTELRVYLGYTGWGARQLESEIERGFWYIFPGDAGLVFDPDPGSLWSRLMARKEQQIARAAIPRPAVAYAGVR
jgi:putative transcriptional regulator